MVERSERAEEGSREEERAGRERQDNDREEANKPALVMAMEVCEKEEAREDGKMGGR